MGLELIKEQETTGGASLDLNRGWINFKISDNGNGNTLELQMIPLDQKNILILEILEVLFTILLLTLCW